MELNAMCKMNDEDREDEIERKQKAARRTKPKGYTRTNNSERNNKNY